MVFCDGVLLAIYSIFLLLTQLKRTKIIREIFRAKAIVLIIAMVTSIGKRISIQESEGFFQFGPELLYAKVDAALLKWHFAFEPQIYLMYGMVNSLFLCEQMLNSYFLFEIYSCTCKMEARGESKRSLTCPILRCSCLSSLFHSWAFPWNWFCITTARIFIRPRASLQWPTYLCSLRMRRALLWCVSMLIPLLKFWLPWKRATNFIKPMLHRHRVRIHSYASLWSRSA